MIRTRVALVTCDRLANLTADDRLLVEPLRELGVDARPATWSDPSVDWSAFDMAVLRSTWDYHERAESFREWLDNVAVRTVLCNPRDLVRWNLDKKYLIELAAIGVPAVPTVEVGSVSDIEALRARGWTDMVLKPRVGLSGIGVRVLRAGDAVDQPAAGTLAQPFARSVQDAGEVSLIHIAGRYSHAVQKLAAGGEFRVQAEYGGTVRSWTPGPMEVEAAARAVASIPGDWLYARVDLLNIDGQPLVSELELIEPELFFRFSESAIRDLARAIADRAAQVRQPLVSSR